MMCGKPILVNKDTSTANKVLEENCGLVVNAKNVHEIKAAIKELRDDQKLCTKLGNNSKKAYERRYQWKIMENKLLTFYQQLK